MNYKLKHRRQYFGTGWLNFLRSGKNTYKDFNNFTGVNLGRMHKLNWYDTVYINREVIASNLLKMMYEL